MCLKRTVKSADPAGDQTKNLKLSAQLSTALFSDIRMELSEDFNQIGCKVGGSCGPKPTRLFNN